jgi:hypothetical protein
MGCRMQWSNTLSSSFVGGEVRWCGDWRRFLASVTVFLDSVAQAAHQLLLAVIRP